MDTAVEVELVLAGAGIGGHILAGAGIEGYILAGAEVDIVLVADMGRERT